MHVLLHVLTTLAILAQSRYAPASVGLRNARPLAAARPATAFRSLKESMRAGPTANLRQTPLPRQNSLAVTTSSSLNMEENRPEEQRKLARVKQMLRKAGLGSLALAGGSALGVGAAIAASKTAVVEAAKPGLEEVMMTQVIPSIGTALSNALYFSFLPGIQAAISAGAIGSLNPIPIVMQLISTISWANYGMAIKNPFITLSNVPAVVLSMWAVASLLPLIKDQAQRKTFTNLLTAGTAGVIGLWSALVFAVNPANHAFVLGASATALCIVLFASPLTAMKEVISKKDASSIYAPFAVVQAINCAMWLAYGLKLNDVWVFGPNATGLGLAMIQLALLLIFRKKPAAGQSGQLAA